MNELHIGIDITLNIVEDSFKLVALSPTPFDEVVYGTTISKANKFTQEFDEKQGDNTTSIQYLEDLALEAKNIIENASVKMLDGIILNTEDKGKFIKYIIKNKLAQRILPTLLDELKKNRETSN